MDVSIIIVNYNTLRLTRDCIESIKEKTHGVDYEIIVVDNGSTDGSRELFENNRDVVYIYSAKNGGFGYGNNIGTLCCLTMQSRSFTIMPKRML